MSDLISRQAAIDALEEERYPCESDYDEGYLSMLDKAIWIMQEWLPSAQPEPSEITDEQAILHLQSTGWMQNHDREMYESGLRKRLADDDAVYRLYKRAYEAGQRNAQPETAKRIVGELSGMVQEVGVVIDMRLVDADHLVSLVNDATILGDGFKQAFTAIVNGEPTIEPERKKGEWIWKGEEGDSRFMCSVCKCKENVPTCNGVPNIWEFCPNCGADMRKEGEHE